MQIIRGWLHGGLLVAALCGGCAAHTPSLKEEWIARLSPSQMEGIYSARADRRQALDEVRRAEVMQEDAQRALVVARIERKAAASGVQAAKERVDAARAVGQEQGISLAQRDLRSAREQLDAAEAAVAWRERVLDSREAAVTLAERQADLQAARLDWVKYQSLREAGDVRVSEIREKPYLDGVARAEGKVDSARRALGATQRMSHAAKARFELRQAALPAYGGSGPNSPP